MSFDYWYFIVSQIYPCSIPLVKEKTGAYEFGPGLRPQHTGIVRCSLPSRTARSHNRASHRAYCRRRGTRPSTINEGCNIIIGHSNGYNEGLDVFAKKYPDVSFYCFEGTTSDDVTTYSIDNMEVMYTLGYICAKVSSGDTLGFIAPMQNSHIIRSLDAYALDAKRANENAKVKVMWVNSWWNPETDKLCAETLIGEGINTIAYYGSTSAALEACEEAGAYCTGFHVDMHDYAPDACLSSFMWNWEPILEQIVERYLAGSDSREFISCGSAEGAALMAPLNEDIIPADVVKDVTDLQKEVMNGEYIVFQGPLTDNQGNEVLAAGNTITGKDLFKIMFLLDNVEGSLDS